MKIAGIYSGFIHDVRDTHPSNDQNAWFHLGTTSTGLEFEETRTFTDVPLFGGTTAVGAIYTGMQVYVNFTLSEFNLVGVQMLLQQFNGDNGNGALGPLGCDVVSNASSAASSVVFRLVEDAGGNCGELAGSLPSYIWMPRAVLSNDSALRFAIANDLIAVPVRLRLFPVCTGSGSSRVTFFYRFLQSDGVSIWQPTDGGGEKIGNTTDCELVNS